MPLLNSLSWILRLNDVRAVEILARGQSLWQGKKYSNIEIVRKWKQCILWTEKK